MITFALLYCVLLLTTVTLAKPLIPNNIDALNDQTAPLPLVKSTEVNNNLKLTKSSTTTENDDAKTPGCGTVPIPQHLQDRVLSLRTSALWHRWNTTFLTYSIRSFAPSEQIRRRKQEEIIADAFYEWSKHVKLNFEKVCKACPADIKIDFIDDDSDDHHDFDDKVSFPSTTYAHAPRPMGQYLYPLFIHFNRKFNFTEKYDDDHSRLNLFHIVLHEIGHTLGLNDIAQKTPSVMYGGYPRPYLRSRVDYMESADQQQIQHLYKKRENNVITKCSTWFVQSLTNVLSLSVEGSGIKDPQQMLAEVALEDSRRKQIATDRIEERTVYAIKGSVSRMSYYKTSGSMLRNSSRDVKGIFFDQFDNLYVSEVSNNRILKYDTNSKSREPTVVAENLNAPRGLYVTDDGDLLYVADRTGIHRFILAQNRTNTSAPKPLFQFETVSEIYSIIVDEDDFHTIYFHDTTAGRIQQCRHSLHRWQCRTIVTLESKNPMIFVESLNTRLFDHLAEDNDLLPHALMILDSNGDILLTSDDTNTTLHFKHHKNSCQIPESPPTTTTTTTITTTTTTTTRRTRNPSKPKYDGLWVDGEKAGIPHDAIEGGKENGQPVYVARFEMSSGEVVLGRLVGGSETAEAHHQGLQTSETYQILTDSPSKYTLSWVPVSDKKVPPCALIAGEEDNVKLYVGRAHISPRTTVIGRYDAFNDLLYVVHNGKDKKTRKNVELLCISKKENKENNGEFWVDGKDTTLLLDAVAGGMENGRPVYVARFKTSEGHILPGRLVKGSKKAEAQYQGVRSSTNYQILTNPNRERTVKWVEPSYGEVPPYALIAGEQGQTNLYVGRARLSSKVTVLGKYVAPQGPLFYVHNGRDAQTNTDVEILCFL